MMREGYKENNNKKMKLMTQGLAPNDDGGT